MEFKEFILAHDGEDVASLALTRKALSMEVDDWDLALSTLQARSKLRHKVPEWYAIPSLQYPKALSAEQCSSTETAYYKASLIFTIFSQARRYAFSGKDARQVAQLSQALRKNQQKCVTGGSIRIADLTGGLGVDAWAFSKVAKEVLYNEMDEGLCSAAKHNFKELGVNNITVTNCEIAPGIRLPIKPAMTNVDVIFLDPARRGDGGRKVFRLEDCSPNVIELLPELYDACPNIMLKLSPMADITQVCKQLPGVREVHVVATGGECKELLLLLEKGYTNDYSTYIYDSGALLKIPDQVRNDTKGVRDDVEGVLEADSHCRPRPAILNDYATWLFEPGKALLKAGAFELPCEYGLSKLGRHTHLYVSQEPVPEELAPFGKCFKIVETLPLSGKTMKDIGKRYPKADVTARNIPMTSEELAKRLGVKPGDGTLHIFGTLSDAQGKLLIIARATEREAPVPPKS